MAVAKPVITPLSVVILQGIYARVCQRQAYQVARMMGDYAEAIRLRSRHAHLRLAGPKGRLP